MHVHSPGNCTQAPLSPTNTIHSWQTFKCCHIWAKLICLMHSIQPKFKLQTSQQLRALTAGTPIQSQGMQTAKQLEVEAPHAQKARSLNKLMPTTIKPAQNTRAWDFIWKVIFRALSDWSNCRWDGTRTPSQGKGWILSDLTNRASPSTFFHRAELRIILPQVS